jgi:CRP-like cAMP-binding protein
VVQIGGEFSALPAARFEQIAGAHEAVREMVGNHTELLIAHLQQRAACHLVHDASSRLASKLLNCAERTGSDTMPLTQDVLSQVLGVRRTTVTLLAQELQRRRLIQYSRGRIIILDRGGLAAKACNCHPMLQGGMLARRLGL